MTASIQTCPIHTLNMKMNNNKPLKLLHLNCQSIVKSHKTLQLLNMTNKHLPDIIKTIAKSKKEEEQPSASEILDEIIRGNNLSILNCEQPTYRRSKNILDLSICSQQLTKYFASHTVLNKSLSDHQPTLTIMNNLQSPTNKQTHKSINWTKFYSILSNNESNQPQIYTEKHLDQEALKITADIKSALSTATHTFNTTSKFKTANIPPELLKLIKQKRKMRRLYQKTNSPIHKTLTNLLDRNCKTELKNFYQNQTLTQFKELNNFKQSETKHWKLLNKLEPQKDNHEVNQNFNFTTTPTDLDTAETFATNLEQIFNIELYPEPARQILAPIPSTALTTFATPKASR
ncbi:endonuclease and reverse transcriptase [Brachionus plicatilis]|uniref:Endonuclease and reverse transcriptase n=1 Tax=Brachionus plicatilis TaxID=10195 RepID=A0A3M7Q3B6_BRAPC|nr:endonuclease and reverse transcriptase [Brachionus plicatilis]